MRWQDLDEDPNGTSARALRAVRLDRAMRAAPRTGRIETLTEASRGRRVVDLGCVGHSVSRIGTPGWLHAEIAAVASTCLGLDLHAAGVARMNELGYTAKCWDIFDDPTDLLEEGPYDVVIAGEFIEHLVDLGVLLRFAKRVLAPKGLLIVTTPNPFAPWRVRAGQVGLVTENADHICLINPSGFAELCDREGVTLQAAWSAEHKAASPPSVKASLWQFLRSTRLEAFLRRRAPSGLNGNWLSPFEVVLARHRASHGWTGETGIYIVSMTPPSSPVDADLDAFDKLTGGFKRS